MDEVCKICLGKGSQHKDIENILKDLLDALIISLDTNKPQKSIICKECVAQIHDLFNFKTLCLYTEDALFPFIEETAGKGAQLDLRSVYSKNKFSESIEKANICRLCLEITTEWVSLDTAISQPSVRDVFEKNLPEISLRAIERPCICGNCIKMLDKLHSFASHCESSANIMEMNGFVENLNIETLIYSTEANDYDNEIKVDIQLDNQVENQVQNLFANEVENQFDKECKIEINENPIDYGEHDVERSVQSISNSERYIKEEEEDDDISGTNNESDLSYTVTQDMLGTQSPLKNSRKPIPCCTCLNTYYDHADLVIHTTNRSENSMYSCHACKIYAKAENTLMEMHIKAHEEKVLEVHCDSGVNVKSSLTEHCEETITSKKTKNLSLRTHVCSLCVKAFSRKTDLNIHFRTHTGEKPHICSTCGKGFSQKQNLKVHLRTHTGEEHHICSLCGKGFTGKINFNLHLRTHEKPHICSTCGKRFTRKTNLNIHLHTHTGKKPYICSICGKGFTENTALKRHLLIHTGEKTHICSLCGKEFNTKGNLNVHLRTHTGQKLHICLTCGKGFSRKTNLNIHLRTHTGDKPHTCLTCGKGFSRKRNLNIHLRTHTREKPHICLVCGRGFSQKTNLNVHLRTHTIRQTPQFC